MGIKRLQLELSRKEKILAENYSKLKSKQKEGEMALEIANSIFDYIISITEKVPCYELCDSFLFEYTKTGIIDCDGTEFEFDNSLVCPHELFLMLKEIFTFYQSLFIVEFISEPTFRLKLTLPAYSFKSQTKSKGGITYE